MRFRLKETISCVTVGTTRITDHDWRSAESFGDYISLERSGFIESEESVNKKAEEQKKAEAETVAEVSEPAVSETTKKK